MIKILPYKNGSNTARALAQELGTLCIHSEPARSKYRGGAGHLIYNYGNGCKTFAWMRNHPDNLILNRPEHIERASNKIHAFHALQEAIESGNYSNIGVPDWTVSRQVATAWAKDGDVVYCRQLTRASQGKGIVVAHSPEEIVIAPLYTKGITNIKREYRAHVFKGEVIDLVAKAVEAGTNGEVDHEIKSHANGWVFVRDAVTIPDDVKTSLVNASIESVEALSLDVAAVDLIRDNKNNIFILEVNTAPGMEGTTLNKYVQALKEYDVKQSTNKNSFNKFGGLAQAHNTEDDTYGM